ncbi:GNAT family N-acetyltransferase [Demequina globuliformis]|uniref:GNAT family N-acetyltransferase n=1 Tax=Demequina globuliformis TaxID=676202 RepID=UPI000780DF0C|nr:GNAT family N-acetyltransferase [Demequina globuliformis]
MADTHNGVSVLSPEVRTATPEDAPTLARLLVEFNHEFDAQVDDIREVEGRLSRLLARRDFFAVLAGDPAIAFATVALRATAYNDSAVAALEDLYVAPQWRGMGVGSTLMEALGERARERGILAAEVFVDEPDAGALRFYQRHGFVHRDPSTGDRAFYLHHDLDSGTRLPHPERQFERSAARS